MNFFLRLFGKKPTLSVNPTFIDNFENLNNWIISTWSAPGTNSTHKGSFDETHVAVGTLGLCLKLTQSKDGSNFYSTGGEVTSKQSFGYGKYEFVVSASANDLGQPISGSITGCFNYRPASITEIDYEVEGLTSRSKFYQFTSWIRESIPNETTAVLPMSSLQLPHHGFHRIAFVWTKGKIEFYRDGVLVATHMKIVPSVPAPFLFNHWGTNDLNWGGLATPGVDRFMYIKSFNFTPL